MRQAFTREHREEDLDSMVHSNILQKNGKHTLLHVTSQHGGLPNGRGGAINKGTRGYARSLWTYVNLSKYNKKNIALLVLT
jgi:hypothetical protein